ncbi:MAG: adenylate kinase [Oscillospiraceae bacterium]|nr:adenylate kinase [Oscillospiraceae bacterium]
MVVLITGASHTGKTALAARLTRERGVPFLSVDHLKMGLIRAGYTALTPEDDAELTEYLWPVVREIVKTAIENGQDLAVEGCYMPFDLRRDFGEEYLPHLRLAVLAFTEAYIDAHFEDISAHADDAERRIDDGWLTQERLKGDNRLVSEGFSRAGERVTMIDGDYETAIERILEELEGK